MLYWVDVRVGVEANNPEEARLKTNKVLASSDEEFNYFVSFNVAKDNKFKTLLDLQREQLKGK